MKLCDVFGLGRLLTLVNSTVLPAQEISPGNLAHTFSIVARDAETGEMGVAVQTHWFGVGTRVTWAEAGVGAIATQSFTNPSFGPRGLALIKQGKTAAKVVKELIDLDRREVHQRRRAHHRRQFFCAGQLDVE